MLRVILHLSNYTRIGRERKKTKVDRERDRERGIERVIEIDR